MMFLDHLSWLDLFPFTRSPKPAHHSCGALVIHTRYCLEYYIFLSFSSYLLGIKCAALSQTGAKIILIGQGGEHMEMHLLVLFPSLRLA